MPAQTAAIGAHANANATAIRFQRIAQPTRKVVDPPGTATQDQEVTDAEWSPGFLQQVGEYPAKGLPAFGGRTSPAESNEFPCRTSGELKNP
jgi:hypothetical protein